MVPVVASNSKYGSYSTGNLLPTTRTNFNYSR